MEEKSETYDKYVKFDVWYLKPPNEVYNIKHDPDYILRGQGKKAVRKIYQDNKWTDFELSHIKQLKEAVQKANDIQLPDETSVVPWEDYDYLKILYCSHFDVPKAIPLCKDYGAWRRDVKNYQIDEMASKILETGVVYNFGKDHQFRPIIVLDLPKLAKWTSQMDEVTRSIFIFLNMIKRHVFVPAYVENWVFIFDAGEQNIGSIPIGAIKKIVSQIQVNFSGCLHSLIILNPNWALKTIWSLVKIVIDAETLKKIKVLSQSDSSQLFQIVDPSMLEKKFGGKQQNLEVFWPPKNIYKDESESPLVKMQARKFQLEAEKKQEQKNNEQEITLIPGLQQNQDKEIQLTQNSQQPQSHRSEKDKQLIQQSPRSPKQIKQQLIIQNPTLPDHPPSTHSTPKKKQYQFNEEDIIVDEPQNQEQVIKSNISNNKGESIYFSAKNHQEEIPSPRLEGNESSALCGCNSNDNCTLI